MFRALVKKLPPGHMITASRTPLGPFEVGQIVALDAAGFNQREIAVFATKVDGTSISFGAVGRALRQRTEDPTWTGERQEGSGRFRDTTPAQRGWHQQRSLEPE